MERITRFRATILITLVCSILVFFAARLYYMQIIETGGVVDNTTVFVTKTRVKAARGDILDRNGNLLVSNRASFDLVINHYVLTSSENPNQHLLNLVNLCRELEIEYTDHLPITKTAPFTYTLEEYSPLWQSYFQIFLSNRGGLDSDISAPLLIDMLRESYGIPEDWTDEEARMVLGIRYELTLRSLTTLSTFEFVQDAGDADLSAVLELNTPGLTVEASTVREYYTEYAAHILGYVGNMSDKQWELDLIARFAEASKKFGISSNLHPHRNTWVQYEDEIDYMLQNPAYIGYIRWSLDGTRAVQKLDFKNENIMTVQERSEGYQKWIAGSDVFDIDIWWDPTFDQGFVTYQDFEKQMAVHIRRIILLPLLTRII